MLTLHANRPLRLIFFALTTLCVAYLALNLGISGMFAFFLTHPICQKKPTKLEGAFTFTDHWLDTADGHQIRVWYYPPKNGIVILAMGGQAGSLGNNLPPILFLLRAGYGVLQIDSRACSVPKAVVSLGGDELYDAEAALSFLIARPEVDRIGAYGFSMGGASVIRTAARNPEIIAVVAEGNYDNLGYEILEPERRKSFPEHLFLRSIALWLWLLSGTNPWSLSPVDDIALISPRPVMLIYGEQEIASGGAARLLAEAGDPKSLWVVPGGSHGRNHLVASDDYEAQILAFFYWALGEKIEPP